MPEEFSFDATNSLGLSNPDATNTDSSSTTSSTTDAVPIFGSHAPLPANDSLPTLKPAPTPTAIGENSSGESTKNLFLELEENGSNTSDKQKKGTESEEDIKDMYVSKYIKGFIIASILTVINIILIGLLYSYNVYISQASKVRPDSDKEAYVTAYKSYLNEITTMIGINHNLEYSDSQLATKENIANFQNITNANNISYIQKKDILAPKLTTINTNVNNNADEIETIKKDIARYGFLPLEIRNILQNEEAISAIQRSLNSLEIIKFSTALKVFSYMDSTVGLIADSLRMDKGSVFAALESFANRGEKDVSNYVYMCHLNPFETTSTTANCSTIGDFDLYYQEILKDSTFEKDLFKKVMRSLDKILETSNVPSFSILFNGFNAGSKTINFNIEVNTTKQDEKALIDKGIKNPHIFIFTSLINLLKQSVFIIGGDINTKTINITTRTIEIGNTPYTVNTSSKQFALPLQKSTEREIFDYIDIEALVNGASDTELEEAEETTLPERELQEEKAEEDWAQEEIAEDTPFPTVPRTSYGEGGSGEATGDFVQQEDFIQQFDNQQPDVLAPAVLRDSGEAAGDYNQQSDLSTNDSLDHPITDTTNEQTIEEAQEFTV